MFCDENKEYYTSDLGEPIKYLDFSTIIFGETLEVKKVIIQNKYGLPLKNILIYIENDFNNINIELSKTQYLFIPIDNLNFEKEYLSNEEEFYVRINSKISKNPESGKFKIYAKDIIK